MRENLKKGQLSITYGMLKDIFTIIEDSDWSERPLSLCGRDIGNLVKKPCSFLSKVKVYQK